MSGYRGFAAQAAVETRLTLRSGESLLLTLGIPALLLGFFATVDVLPLPGRRSVEFLAPGVLALAVMSTAMVSLAIATGFQRSYGFLKRLGTTPLGRPALLAAKTASIVAVEALQAVVLTGVALALGWEPDVAVAAAAGAVVLGTVAFAGLGLLLAGSLRAEVTLAAANGIYLVLLLLGGMVIPLSELPAGLRNVAQLLPSAALADLLRDALTGFPTSGGDWLVLGAWAVAAPLAASLSFRWE